MLVMKHREFRLPRSRFYWSAEALYRDQERIRLQAQDYINDVIGSAKVVSVSESTFSVYLRVIVWYREEAEASAKPAKDVLAEL